MTTGENIGLTATIIGATILSIAMIHQRQKEHEFKIWVSYFELGLGSKVPDDDVDSILRDLFSDSDITLEYAIELYKDIKGL